MLYTRAVYLLADVWNIIGKMVWQPLANILN